MENLFTKIDTTHGVCYNGDFNKGFESIKEIQTKIVFK